MGDDSRIQWTDATWNPLRGCSRVSEGCRNCYAEKHAYRFRGPGLPYEGLTDDKGRWNGAIMLVQHKLTQPLRWTKARRIFVNSMSDLFHPRVPDEYIAAVFGVMAASPWHTYQVLTKRPERAAKFFEWLDEQADRALSEAVGEGGTSRLPFDDWRVTECHYHALRYDDDDGTVHTKSGHLPGWPLPNVWLGVSVEDQATADERIPQLLDLPAAVRFVSYEPALGPVDWSAHFEARAYAPDWVIAGGESGRDARPCELKWLRRTVWQCKGAGVACFIKQLGARASDPENGIAGAKLHVPAEAAPLISRRLKDKKGGDINEWPSVLRVREWPG